MNSDTPILQYSHTSSISALLLIRVIIFMAVFTGCRKPELADSKLLPRVERISSGPVELTMTVDPSSIHLERDVLLTIQTRAPSSMDIRLSPIQDRLTGFTLNGDFDREPVEKDGRIIYEHCFRLTPTLSDEYRIGPMAITTVDRSQQPFFENWFATRPMHFELSPLIAGKPRTVIEDIIGPVWIHPSLRTVALWILAVILVIIIGALIWWIGRKIRRTIRLRRMSPKERALYELAELTAKDLISKNRIKEFYLELTMIVRRYIERAHAIRAPEQTTEEFLAAATEDLRFSHEVVLKLQNFLQKADLVKFAAFHPDQPAIDRALATARDYIETDEQETHVIKKGIERDRR